MRRFWAGLVAVSAGAGCAQLLGIDQEYQSRADGSASEAGEPGGDAGSFDCAALAGSVWQDHCYFVIGSGTGLAWSAAEAACEAFSAAHLVTVSSAEEQSMLEQTFFPATSDRWIGLSLADVTAQAPPASCKGDPASCPFRWVGGERLSFSKWARRGSSELEPNYSGACVRMQFSDLSWADYGCGTQLPALCEYAYE